MERKWGVEGEGGGRREGLMELPIYRWTSPIMLIYFSFSISFFFCHLNLHVWFFFFFNSTLVLFIFISNKIFWKKKLYIRYMRVNLYNLHFLSLQFSILSTKHKWEKTKFFLSLPNFLSFHFSTPPNKWTLSLHFPS